MAGALAAGLFPRAVAASDETARFSLRASRIGRDFEISVTPPLQPAARPLPCVYLLDAGYGVAAGAALAMQAQGLMAPAFTVGVGYPDGARNLRETDLLHRRAPSSSGAMIGGGGAAFEAFVVEQVKPLIEARYAVDPRRSFLLGHSLAGLFTTNVLADRPHAFAGYLMASPSLWADPTALDRVRAAAPRGGGRLAFVTVGGAETARMKAGVEALRDILGGPRSTFRLAGETFPGQTHMSYYPAFLAAALPAALPPGRRSG